VIDLVSVLQQSLNQTGRGGKKKTAHKPARRKAA
jgi:non-homologous end joining protein Ku